MPPFSGATPRGSRDVGSATGAAAHALIAPELDSKRMHAKWLSLVFSLALAAGCSSEAKPPPRAAAAPIAQPAPPPAPAPTPPPPKQAAALQVSDDIQSACKLPGLQTHFGYNSARLRPQDQAFVKQLTDCFTRGPLAQRQLRLVGHADARGGADYNFALGRNRADSIKAAMLALGLPKQRATTESRGKLDATGTDEAGWARDRRVVASLL